MFFNGAKIRILFETTKQFLSFFAEAEYFSIRLGYLEIRLGY